MENISPYSRLYQKVAHALRLRGPLAGDANARIFHFLLLVLFAWGIFDPIFFLPREAKKATNAAFDAFVLVVIVAALALLHRGFLRSSGITFLSGWGLVVTVGIALNGGIHSPANAYYVALSISAVWLLGRRAALVTAGIFILMCLIMAELELHGLPMPKYLPGTPFGLFSAIAQSMVIALAPAMAVLRILQESLASLREHQQHLEEIVLLRTAELVEARDLAQAANKAKSSFLANMSHELRTPLNAILGFSALVRDDPGLSSAHRRDLDIVNRSGEHLLNLIDEVLDVAKIEAGRTTIKSAAFDLHKLVSEAVEMTRPRANEKNLKLFLELSPAVPRFARSDAAKLRQVLINLIGNAVKYTPQGSVTVNIQSREQQSGVFALVMEVADTGIGIAPEDQGRIFDPFFQAENRGERKGTGLGLAITQRFVELMGGSITIESAPGKGSSFRVELPVELAADSEITESEIDRKRAVGLAPGQPECRVLIVEDQPENWMVLRRILQDSGFQVRVAEAGELGIEMFRSWKPQFIWMDLRMPGIGGVETTRRIRQLEGGREVKIAAVTASAFSEQREQVLAAGLDDFIRKPYRAEEILDCMARHLGVKYRYQAAPRAADQDMMLRPEAVAALPQELRQELADALVKLNAKRIAQVIGRVSDVDPSLAAVLTRHAETFSYSVILSALNAGTAVAGHA